MADDPTGGASGSNDRATVALVNAKLDEVRARIDGNAQVTHAHFETIKTRLDGLGNLPAQIGAVDTRLGKRIDALEDKYIVLQAAAAQAERAKTYRSSVLPGVLVGCGALIVSIVTIVVTGSP